LQHVREPTITLQQQERARDQVIGVHETRTFGEPKVSTR